MDDPDLELMLLLLGVFSLIHLIT